jgi:hypothetical protein
MRNFQRWIIVFPLYNIVILCITHLCLIYLSQENKYSQKLALRVELEICLNTTPCW